MVFSPLSLKFLLLTFILPFLNIRVNQTGKKYFIVFTHILSKRFYMLFIHFTDQFHYDYDINAISSFCLSMGEEIVCFLQINW